MESDLVSWHLHSRPRKPVSNATQIQVWPALLFIRRNIANSSFSKPWQHIPAIVFSPNTVLPGCNDSQSDQLLQTSAECLAHLNNLWWRNIWVNVTARWLIYSAAKNNSYGAECGVGANPASSDWPPFAVQPIVPLARHLMDETETGAMTVCRLAPTYTHIYEYIWSVMMLIMNCFFYW